MELLFQQPARLRRGRVFREVKIPSFKGSLDETLKTEPGETNLPLCPKVGFVKQICQPENITDPSKSSRQYILPF